MNDMLSDFSQWLDNYELHLLASVIALLAYRLITQFALPRIERSIDRAGFKSRSSRRAYHTIRLLVATATIAVLLIIWGVDISGLLLISTSVITLTGVALFANWSILSNVTCYLFMIFNDNYRRGNFIRVVEGDNYIEGFISELGLLNTKLVTEQREVVLYPNNLLMARPTLVNPREKFRGMGKVTTPVPVPVKRRFGYGKDKRF